MTHDWVGMEHILNRLGMKKTLRLGGESSVGLADEAGRS
jgi:hypothetical protein